MKKLLTIIEEEARCENVAGIFLHPAVKNLGNYYRKLGFEDFFYGKSVFFSRIGRKECAKGAMSFISFEEYYKKRTIWLEDFCFVNWDEDFFRFLYETGSRYCAFLDAIFSFRIEEKKIIVDEFLGNLPSSQIADLLFYHLPESDKIEIRLLGNKNCFGQIKWYNHIGKNIDNGYFAFAME